MDADFDNVQTIFVFMSRRPWNRVEPQLSPRAMNALWRLAAQPSQSRLQPPRLLCTSSPRLASTLPFSFTLWGSPSTGNLFLRFWVAAMMLLGPVTCRLLESSPVSTGKDELPVDAKAPCAGSVPNKLPTDLVCYLDNVVEVILFALCFNFYMISTKYFQC